MRFLRSPLGTIAILVGLAVAAFCAYAIVQVNSLTGVRRPLAVAPIDLEAVLPGVELVRFQAADGVPLAAWLAPGVPGRPAIVLCHGLGADKSALTHIAVPLRRQGFTLLLLDFRAHGESGGRRSTLGLDEKRDVLAAVDYLDTRAGIDPRRVGIYGIGMGAHAAILAAADRPKLKVLVLDEVYPDIGYALAQAVFADWALARRHLAFVPLGVLAVLQASSPLKQTAAGELPGLRGRDVLLLAPESDPQLAAAMTRMYETIPDQADADGNIAFMSATHAEGLYGADLDAYHERVVEFFRSRLRAPLAPGPR